MLLACIALDLMAKERSHQPPEDCSLGHKREHWKDHSSHIAQTLPLCTKYRGISMETSQFCVLARKWNGGFFPMDPEFRESLMLPQKTFWKDVITEPRRKKALKHQRRRGKKGRAGGSRSQLEVKDRTWQSWQNYKMEAS
ncbi:uncharacterized protein LOC144243797 isoform X2 [Crocuta crocuta]